mgnify:CR=1 FL=1
MFDEYAKKLKELEQDVPKIFKKVAKKGAIKFVKEAKELSRFKKINQKNKDKNIDHVRFAMLLWMGINLLINIIFVFLLCH